MPERTGRVMRSAAGCGAIQPASICNACALCEPGSTVYTHSVCSASPGTWNDS